MSCCQAAWAWLHWGWPAVSPRPNRMAPIPTYHWCPGDNWDPGWGNNWDGGNCHDDHHRDIDYNNHDHDYWGDNGPGRWGPPPPPCIPFVNCPR